jgi:hypothetical protein
MNPARSVKITCAILWLWAGHWLLAATMAAPVRGDEPANVPREEVRAGRVEMPGFRLGPGGVFEWPGLLRLAHGGQGGGLPPVGGLIRAQPGGNLVLQPQGDYMRNAIDLLPTAGKPADMDAIAELTLHRVHPTRTTQEMISYSALARAQGVYAVIVEAHGAGQLRPLSFMVVKGGINPGETPFSAEAMRMTEEGTMVFGLSRQGGPLKRSVDAITVDQPPPAPGTTSDSDAIKWVGKAHDGRGVHVANWRAAVRVNDTAASRFVLGSDIYGAPARSRLEVRDQGDLELPTPGAGIVLRSPSGKRWRVSVDDEGRLQTRPAP